MANYRISATQLDSMWKHTLPEYIKFDDGDEYGDYRHLTAEQLVRYLTQVDEKAPALVRGGTLHEILEHPDKYYNPLYDLHIHNGYALQVDEYQATKLLPPDIELVEPKGVLDFNIGWDKVTLVAKADVITPNAIVDYKFSGQQASQYVYSDFYQWRANLLVFNKPCFIYRHIQIKEVEVPTQYNLCTVKAIENTALYPYSEMFDDVAAMCEELIRFCNNHNIAHVIAPK